MSLPTRPFGTTGLRAPVLGFGAGSLGDPDDDDAAIGRLLHRALDLGVVFVDTAPSYGASEDRIGRHLADRRQDYLLSTKVGYGVPGVTDWTYEAVAQGVDAALQRLRTDHLDIAHLHSCPAEVLERGDVIRGLTDAVTAGKVRVAAYSGDAHDLYVALETGAFGAVQASLSVQDRHNAPTLAIARARGLGTIGKRPLANAPWRFDAAPARPDEAEHFRRWRALAIETGELDPAQLYLRYALFHPETDVTLMGTHRLRHLESAAAAVEAGPLPAGVLAHLDARWSAVGQDFAPLT